MKWKSLKWSNMKYSRRNEAKQAQSITDVLDRINWWWAGTAGEGMTDSLSHIHQGFHWINWCPGKLKNVSGTTDSFDHEHEGNTESIGVSEGRWRTDWQIHSVKVHESRTESVGDARGPGSQPPNGSIVQYDWFIRIVQNGGADLVGKGRISARWSNC